MKSQLKEIIRNINTELFGVETINFASFRKLLVEEGNLIYVLRLEEKKLELNYAFNQKDVIKDFIEFWKNDN